MGLLSDRETEILGLLDLGYTTDGVAEELGLSRWSVKDKIQRMQEKLDCPRVRDLPDCARKAGIEVEDLSDELI